MELIPYSQFSKLRLRQFDPSASNEEEIAGFEFMGLVWFEELAEGVEFLRHENDPHRLGAVGITFEYVAPKLVAAILAATHLPLRHRMTMDDVASVLGASTRKEEAASEFVSHDFYCGDTDRYLVRCWFHTGEGPRGVEVMRADLLSHETDAA